MLPFFLQGATTCILVSRSLIVGALWLEKFEPNCTFGASRLKSLKSPFKYKKASKLILLILRCLEGVGVRSFFLFPSIGKICLDRGIFVVYY